MKKRLTKFFLKLRRAAVYLLRQLFALLLLYAVSCLVGIPIAAGMGILLVADGSKPVSLPLLVAINAVPWMAIVRYLWRHRIHDLTKEYCPVCGGNVFTNGAGYDWCRRCRWERGVFTAPPLPW